MKINEKPFSYKIQVIKCLEIVAHAIEPELSVNNTNR